MTSPLIFDTAALYRQRERHAPTAMADAFLLDEVGSRLIDRLTDIKRDFGDVLDLGSRHGSLGRALLVHRPETRLVSLDPAPSLVRHAPGSTVVGDLEALPFGEHRFDAIFSALTLHAVNDLPGVLVQARRALRPDGLLLMALPGGETLQELRQALMIAEAEVTGGASPRVMPFVDVRDLGALLQRAGFALPVADVDRITLTYGEPISLLQELRRAGEANMLVERDRRPMRREVLLRMADHYLNIHADERGRARVTVDVLFATAWAPHASQQQPARRGSGTVNLAKAMGVDPRILEGRGADDEER